jgi:peptidyl-prolyl cis-trans isomerase SurA
VAALALLVGGCALPAWVPFAGKSAAKSPAGSVTPGLARATGSEGSRGRSVESGPRRLEIDDSVTDRIVAVVNNDAITLADLQESIVVARQENRQAGGATDDEMMQQFLVRLIDVRLQLQEADRERIVVEDTEIEEELADRVKKLPGNATKEDFEAAVKAQGLTMEAVKRRVRDSLRLAKVVRRKVALRVSVNDQEVDRYLEQNRAKLETGLAYHARHILIPPEAGAPADVAWETARIRAGVLLQQILAGADFAELARQHSKDASGRDGGDLGTLKRGELAADIEAEILKLEPGEVSAPYRSPLGYHLFRLESKESLEGPGLARARQQIRDILFREKYETRLEAWLKEIKQRAIIEVRI